MIRFLINAAFELQCLLEGGAYYDRMLTVWRLLKGGVYLMPVAF